MSNFLSRNRITYSLYFLQHFAYMVDPWTMREFRARVKGADLSPPHTHSWKSVFCYLCLKNKATDKSFTQGQEAETVCIESGLKTLVLIPCIVISNQTQTFPLHLKICKMKTQVLYLWKKNPHISGPMQFKLFKGQLYHLFSYAQQPVRGKAGIIIYK